MPKSDRLGGGPEWNDLEFVERERTPRQAIELDIQLHLAGFSLSNTNTKQRLEKLVIERSRTALHNWVQKDDLQPTSYDAPNQIAVNDAMIRIHDERRWLYAAVDPDTNTNNFLHVRLFQTRNTQLTVLFLRELRERQQVEQGTFLIDGAHYLKATVERLGLRFR